MRIESMPYEQYWTMGKAGAGGSDLAAAVSG